MNAILDFIENKALLESILTSPGQGFAVENPATTDTIAWVPDLATEEIRSAIDAVGSI